VKHTHWHVAPHRGFQSLWPIAIYASLCILLLYWLYELP